jgi:hypothetical protein
MTAQKSGVAVDQFLTLWFPSSGPFIKAAAD